MSHLHNFQTSKQSNHCRVLIFIAIIYIFALAYVSMSSVCFLPITQKNYLTQLTQLK